MNTRFDLHDNPNCNCVAGSCCCITSTAAILGCLSLNNVVLAGVAVKSIVSAKLCNIIAATSGAISNLATAYDDSDEPEYKHCQGGLKAVVPLSAATLATVVDNAATGGVVSAGANCLNISWQGVNQLMVDSVNSQTEEKLTKQMMIQLDPPPVRLSKSR